MQENMLKPLAFFRLFWYHIRAFHTGVDSSPCGLKPLRLRLGGEEEISGGK